MDLLPRRTRDLGILRRNVQFQAGRSRLEAVDESCSACVKLNCWTVLCVACQRKRIEGSVSCKRPAETELENQVRFLQRCEPPRPLSKEFCGDVRLVGCDEEHVYAHRFILAGKSAVFRRMFDTDMKETRNGIVRVHDASASVLRSVVNFCYTADIRFTEEAPVEEVFKVAHKYDIEYLQDLCVSELCTSINEENLCKRLILAHLYDVKKLKDQVAKFFNENFDEVYTEVVGRLIPESEA